MADGLLDTTMYLPERELADFKYMTRLFDLQQIETQLQSYVKDKVCLAYFHPTINFTLSVSNEACDFHISYIGTFPYYDVSV